MNNFSIQSIYNWYRNSIRNPKYRWWVILGTIVYIISPIDIAPDFIPIIPRSQVSLRNPTSQAR